MSMTSIRQVVGLTGVLARSEYRLRFAGSALGAIWSAAKPLALFGVLYFAFSYVMRFGDGIDRYPLQLLLGIVLWAFFAEATAASTTVLVARADMIRKISFPRIVLPLSVSGTAAVVMAFNLVAVLAICALAGVSPRAEWLLLIPLLAELALLTVGASLFLAAAFVRFRDIGQAWDVGLQLLFYSTPIIYPITLAPEHLHRLLLSNPIAQIIQDARQIVIAPASGTGLEHWSLLDRGVPIGATVITFAIGYVVFQRAASRVAEHV